MKDISQAPGDLTKFLDNMLHNTVVSFHSDLSSKRVSPWDTGRFAASWFVEGGESQVIELQEQAYKLSNPLPYAERLCFGNWAVSQPKNWFPAYFNSKGQGVVNRAAKKAEGLL